VTSSPKLIKQTVIRRGCGIYSGPVQTAMGRSCALRNVTDDNKGMSFGKMLDRKRTAHREFLLPNEVVAG
jgi:hypothetical protein